MHPSPIRSLSFSLCREMRLNRGPHRCEMARSAIIFAPTQSVEARDLLRRARDNPLHNSHRETALERSTRLRRFRGRRAPPDPQAVPQFATWAWLCQTLLMARLRCGTAKSKAKPWGKEFPQTLFFFFKRFSHAPSLPRSAWERQGGGESLQKLVKKM